MRYENPTVQLLHSATTLILSGSSGPNAKLATTCAEAGTGGSTGGAYEVDE